MKLFDWLGAARRVNDEVNADAVRIAALELALRQANLKAIIWQTKAEDLQDKLDEARNTIAVSDAHILHLQPLVAYALRQKANRARYDAKRRRR